MQAEASKQDISSQILIAWGFCIAMRRCARGQQRVISRRSLGPDQARFFGLFLPHELTYGPLNRVLLWTVKPASQEEEAWRQGRGRGEGRLRRPMADRQDTQAAATRSESAAQGPLHRVDGSGALDSMISSTAELRACFPFVGS